jgi:uncharacterized 2Fe-2S/4Fe-4S cluster protein (DUF4445 family)
LKPFSCCSCSRGGWISVVWRVSRFACIKVGALVTKGCGGAAVWGRIQEGEKRQKSDLADSRKKHFRTRGRRLGLSDIRGSLKRNVGFPISSAKYLKYLTRGILETDVAVQRSAASCEQLVRDSITLSRSVKWTHYRHCFETIKRILKLPKSELCPKPEISSPASHITAAKIFDLGVFWFFGPQTIRVPAR